jgi:putative ABC transport system permease protein
MRFFDLVNLIFENLGRRKGRVALTAVGVIIGTAAVVILVSLAIGLQENARNQLIGIGDLTIITVIPNYGSGEVVSVPRGGGGGSPGNQPDLKLITDDSLTELSSLLNVVAVYPRDYMYAESMMYYKRLETWFGAQGIPGDALTSMGKTALQGDLDLTKGEIIIGAKFNQNFYDPNYRPGQDPPTPPDLFGQSVKLKLFKYDAEGNRISKDYTLKVTGILEENAMDDWSTYLSIEDVTAMNEWVNGKRINRNIDGYPEAMVKVDDPENVSPVYDAILALGYMAYSAQPYVEGVNSFFLILQVAFGGVGAIALLVAAIGIANTMAMAILERTREIGLMKALGATNRDILSVFLGEAAGIGMLGGLGGILIGWIIGQLLNVVMLAYLAGQAVEQGGPPPPSAAIVTPAWLMIFALLFATLIGLVSGIYPALRAATLVPINALKYE